MATLHNKFIYTLAVSAALFLSACAIPIDPSLLDNKASSYQAEGASAQDVSAEIPQGVDPKLIAPYLEQKPIPIQGKVQKQTIAGSQAGEQTFFVYLPAGYESGDQRYRTLYHLHGAYLQESWAGYECNYIGAKVESAVSDGIIEPMIVVCLVDPDGDRMWSDSFDNKYLASTALLQDVIPHIDATYRTVPERGGRALQGFSMGGFGAVVNGFRAPELFSAIIVWDGALHYWQSLTMGRQQIAAKMFKTEAYFNQWSPWALTQDSAGVDLDMLLVAGEMEIVVNFNNRFRTHLESVGQDFTFLDASCPHSIFCLMDQHGEEAFSFLAASFARHDEGL